MSNVGAVSKIFECLEILLVTVLNYTQIRSSEDRIIIDFAHQDWNYLIFSLTGFGIIYERFDLASTVVSFNELFCSGCTPLPQIAHCEGSNPSAAAGLVHTYVNGVVHSQISLLSTNTAIASETITMFS